MKKVFYSLICLIALSACSSENVALDALKVYDVANSSCKTTLSKEETRSDFYEENISKPTTLNIELGKDGIAQCSFEDVEANCAVRNIYVNVANQDQSDYFGCLSQRSRGICRLYLQVRRELQDEQTTVGQLSAESILCRSEYEV